MLKIPIKQQPDETTCGPTCLHAVYQYYNDPMSLEQVIDEIEILEGGGTLGAWLAVHALQRGYCADIYSYHLQIFDPTWFVINRDQLIWKLNRQLEFKTDIKLKTATGAYLRFLELGGELKFEDLRPALLRRYLKAGKPVIAGLSATYLYRSPREFGTDLDYDDIRGEPAGHFVVLHGYKRETREIAIADPIMKNPLGKGKSYEMKIDRVLNSVLLGNVTYDANLIIIRPGKNRK